MVEPKVIHIVKWIHGVQQSGFDPAPIRNCISKVSEMVKTNGDVWDHGIFNWDEAVSVRETTLWERMSKRGNWLARQIRHAICFIGCDMWWLLQTLKDGKPGFITYEVMRKLERLFADTIDYFKSNPTKIKYHLVCHSFGCWVGLYYIISHPETDFCLVTIGCPLMFGSGAFDDWGDPSKIPNLKSWVNVGIRNDPIS